MPILLEEADIQHNQEPGRSPKSFFVTPLTGSVKFDPATTHYWLTEALKKKRLSPQWRS